MNTTFANNNTCAIEKYTLARLIQKILLMLNYIFMYKIWVKSSVNKNTTSVNKKNYIWTEETKHEEKDVNQWYFVPGRYAYRYKGEWANGLINGKGIKEYYGSTDNNHSILECNFIDGKANGYGKQTFDITRDEEETAPYYEGEFKDNLQHGNGTYHYGNGCYRKGNLVEGKFEGKGIYYDSFKERTWVGIYVDDKRDLDNGVWYDGELTMEDHELNDKVNKNTEVKMR
jgi:hypothetical protein